jgi:hypothetical protein
MSAAATASAATTTPTSIGKKDSVFAGKEKAVDVRHANIVAAKAVAEVVRTSLGPKGMDKMIQSSDGEVIITNDGATILAKMEVQHPAAKMVRPRRVCLSLRGGNSRLVCSSPARLLFAVCVGSWWMCPRPRTWRLVTARPLWWCWPALCSMRLALCWPKACTRLSSQMHGSPPSANLRRFCAASPFRSISPTAKR